MVNATVKVYNLYTGELVTNETLVTDDYGETSEEEAPPGGTITDSNGNNPPILLGGGGSAGRLMSLVTPLAKMSVNN